MIGDKVVTPQGVGALHGRMSLGGMVFHKKRVLQNAREGPLGPMLGLKVVETMVIMITMGKVGSLRGFRSLVREGGRKEGHQRMKKGGTPAFLCQNRELQGDGIALPAA